MLLSIRINENSSEVGGRQQQVEAVSPSMKKPFDLLTIGLVVLDKYFSVASAVKHVEYERFGTILFRRYLSIEPLANCLLHFPSIGIEREDSVEATSADIFDTSCFRCGNVAILVLTKACLEVICEDVSDVIPRDIYLVKFDG